jgi:hypothetical protein
MNSNPAIWWSNFIILQARSKFEPMSRFGRYLYLLPFAIFTVAGVFNQNVLEMIGWMVPVYILVFLGWGIENREWAYKKISDFVSSILHAIGLIIVQIKNDFGFTSRSLPVPEYPPRASRA